MEFRIGRSRAENTQGSGVCSGRGGRPGGWRCRSFLCPGGPVSPGGSVLQPSTWRGAPTGGLRTCCFRPGRAASVRPRRTFRNPRHRSLPKHRALSVGLEASLLCLFIWKPLSGRGGPVGQDAFGEKAGAGTGRRRWGQSERHQPAESGTASGSTPSRRHQPFKAPVPPPTGQSWSQGTIPGKPFQNTGPKTSLSATAQHSLSGLESPSRVLEPRPGSGEP